MIALVVIFVVIVVWGLIGVVIRVSARPVPASPTRAGCDDCAQADAVWNSLDGFGKFGIAVWYGLVKAACAIRGC
jgi:hypothetical protein